MGAVIYLVILLGAFGFLIVLPQRRRMQAFSTLQSQLEEGDEIVTTAGIFGRIVSLGDDTCDVEIAPGTTIKLARQAVARRILPDMDDGNDAPDDADGHHDGN